MNKQSKHVWVVGFLLVASLLVPLALVHAQIVPNCNPVPGNANSCGVKDLFQLLINVYNFFLGLGGLVALLFIIWGGIQMILGFVDGGEHSVESGKATVKNGIIGLVILACGYLIVNTVIMLLGGGGIDALLKPFTG
jgi:hypothetical protein